MQTPAWNDTALKAGVMVRGALWLIQDVGLGNVFTKEDIRRAFPGVAQADRRIRDLRDYGWVLHTRREDATLTLEQTRFVAAGAEVWNPRERRAASPDKGTSNKEREAVLARDEYMCTVCGISGAEEYPDDPTQTGVLGVTTVITLMPDGTEIRSLATVCKRCKAGGGSKRVDMRTALDAVRVLSPSDKQRLAAWVRARRRERTAIERAWSQYCRLPKEGRDAVEELLRDGPSRPSP